MKISEMRNLGIASAENLADAGIDTPAQLQEMGAAQAYLALKFFVGSQVTLNFLWGIEGALTHKDWRDITPERKQELKIAVGHYKGGYKGHDKKSHNKS
ncbi:MAG: TfoX/Sxy family protein [Rhizobiales bacterium]|nr:TfoX/Sxy family protein [Hyphomicrobiales bacterium]NRB13614.1 TfoX/Sxy family protein [Hyphomicrobiales bacterium]